MSGIVFFRSTNHDEVVTFYRDRLGFETWVEQVDCTILRHENLLVGFCDRDRADTEGILTIVYPDRAGVDAAHDRLGERARGAPEYNEEYDIYQFFATDPEGRTLEFQTFEHELPPI
ncbi:MAG: VOC family protein [Halodesulfurarchaeum sp.]